MMRFTLCHSADTLQYVPLRQDDTPQKGEKTIHYSASQGQHQVQPPALTTLRTS